MSPEMLFDYMGVRLNGEKAAGKTARFNVNFTDIGKAYGLTMENGVLNYGKPLADPKATVTLTKATMDQIQLGETTIDKAIDRGAARIDGDRAQPSDFVGSLDKFPFWFNIVTP